MKVTPKFLRVLLIIYIVEAGAMLLAGIVMSIISFMHGLYPVVGPFLFIAGLVQLLVGVWLFKRGGKGILGGGTGIAK